MSRKKTDSTAGEQKESRQAERGELKFSRQQVLASARYKNRKDLVSTLLDDGRMYTIAEVDGMVDRFMKGAVK